MSSPPSDEVLDRVYRRAEAIRRRRRWRAAPIAIAIVVALIAIPIVWTSGHDDASQVVTDDGSDQPAAPPPPPPASGSVFYGFSVWSSGPALTQFDSISSDVVMTYPIGALPGEPSAGQGFTIPDSLRLSPDGSTLYFRRVSGTCGATIFAVDVHDPSSLRKVLEAPPDAGIGDFAPTTEGRIVWYRCSTDGRTGAIVVTDLANGSEHEINYDPQLGTPGLSVSSDGRTLAVAIYAHGILPAEVRLVPIDTESATAVQDAQPLEPPAGCGFDLPKFGAASGELYVVENCGPILGQGGRLVALDLATGASRLILAGDPDTSLVDYSVARSGDHVLLSRSSALTPGGKVGDGATPTTFRIDDGQPPVPLPLVRTFIPPSRTSANLVW